jgi:hypothetical protein
MRAKGERARVLVTVKATPQPSGKYGDTSCVAGVRLDGERPTWIRLYPIAFRWLDGDAQFRKYQVIEVEVRRRDSDTRRESYSPTQNSWNVVETLPPWEARHAVISRLAPTTTCELRRAAAVDDAAPSLGLVYPSDVEGLLFEAHPKWTPAQLENMRSRAVKEAAALVSVGGVVPPQLREPRFKVRYRYRCGDAGCGGHVGRILDWELTALQNRVGGSDAQVRDAVIQKFQGEMFAPDRRSGFYMGNFEDAAKRASFSVLGVYWPREVDVRETLF